MQRQSLTCSSQIGCIWPRVICCTSKRAISLNYRAIEPAEASPAAAAKTCVVLHGLLGSSQNWTNFARSLQRQLPTWRFILCDLRGHGGSHGFAEPHTIRSAAGDVADLTSQLAVPIDAIVGHSLGGKIALQVLADGAVNQNSLLQAVIVDTIPGCWDQERNDSDKDGITRVFNFIRDTPEPLPSREALVDRCLAAGFSRSMAAWMTTNVKRHAAGQHGERDPKRGFEWVFDVDVASALYRDHLQTNLWDTVYSPPPDTALTVVAATRSSRWTDPLVWSQLQRVFGSQCETPAGADGVNPNAAHSTAGSGPSRAGLLGGTRWQGVESRTELEWVESGHWVHVDNPKALAGILRRILEQTRDGVVL